MSPTSQLATVGGSFQKGEEKPYLWMVSKGIKRESYLHRSLQSPFPYWSRITPQENSSPALLLFKKIFTYLFGRAWSKLWHEGSLVATCELLVVTCEIQFPDQGSNFRHWEWGLLATGPLGKSPSCASELYHPALRQEPRKLKCTLQSITSESGSGDQRQ